MTYDRRLAATGRRDSVMARPPRIEYEGAVYHVTSRENDRQDVFFSDRDYGKALEYRAAAKEKYGCVIHAYVLMTNHYHLLLETPRPNLSRVMHFMNGSYTTHVNIKKRRKVGTWLYGFLSQFRWWQKESWSPAVFATVSEDSMGMFSG